MGGAGGSGREGEGVRTEDATLLFTVAELDDRWAAGKLQGARGRGYCREWVCGGMDVEFRFRASEVRERPTVSHFQSLSTVSLSHTHRHTHICTRAHTHAHTGRLKHIRPPTEARAPLHHEHHPPRSGQHLTLTWGSHPGTQLVLGTVQELG